MLVYIYQGDRAVVDVDGVDFHYDVPLEPVYMYLDLYYICTTYTCEFVCSCVFTNETGL